MIDEKKLIEEFTSLPDRDWYTPWIVDVINNQPKVDVPEINVGKMIPCSCDMPKYSDELLLIQCSGKPVHNVTFKEAYALATYTKEGWILEGWPELEDPEVISWYPLPEGYCTEMEEHLKPSWEESVLRTFLGGDT